MDEPDVLQLSSGPDAVPRARRFVSERLTGSGLSSYADDVELTVAELVTNAVLHGAPPLSLRITPQDDLVRIEVGDGSRQTPVRGRADVASMTGRGLALVEALATRWGVEPVADGKVVWAEVGSGDVTMLPTDLDGDIEALLAAWSDDEIAVPRVSVHLGDVPTDLLLEAKAHVDSVVREFALAASGASTGSSAAVPRRLAELIETVENRFAEARQSIKRQALAAAARGDRRTDLTLTLPPSMADDAEAYLAGLNEADSYARASRLLTLESPPQHRSFRQWYINALATQLRAAGERRTPPPLETFEEHLLADFGEQATARANLERIASLQGVTAALAGTTTVIDVATVVIDEGVRALGAVSGGLLLRDRTGRLTVPSSVGYDRSLIETLLNDPKQSELPAPTAVRTGRPVWIESPQDRNERFRALVEIEPHTAALCAVPLHVRGETVGALRFSFADPRLFDEYEQRFVLGLADQTAQAIDRALLYEAERRAREHAEGLAARLIRLQQVATELGRAATVDEVAEVVVTHAAEIVGSGLATVSLLVDPDTLEIVKTRGISAGAVQRWRRYQATEDVPAGMAIRTGESVVLADRHEILERFPRLAQERSMPEGALACIPMHVGRRAIGAITLSFPPGRDIGGRTDLAFLASLADNCAQAIERARAVTSLETAVAKVSLLAEATGELVASRDFRRALSTLARLMVPDLADWCAVDIVVGGRIERVALAHVDPAKLAAGRELHRRQAESSDDSAVVRVIRTGVSELIGDIDERVMVERANDEQRRIVEDFGLRSALVVPLAGTSTVGAITLVNDTSSDRRFDQQDLAFVEDIGRRAGAAVENLMSAEAYRADNEGVSSGG